MEYVLQKTGGSVDETLVCGHSNKSYHTVLSYGTVYYALYHATEKTANQNAGKPLYIRQYSTETFPSISTIQTVPHPTFPSGHSVFYDTI